jgi:hypothetical protein
VCAGESFFGNLVRHVRRLINFLIIISVLNNLIVQQYYKQNTVILK